MKNKKITSLIISSAVCLLPILFGVLLWDKLPDKVAIHFDFHNRPDNFASKEFAVFILPLIMLALHIACNLINFPTRNGHKTPEIITKWIIPVVAFIVEMTILLYAIGWNINIKIVALLILGTGLIVSTLAKNS